MRLTNNIKDLYDWDLIDVNRLIIQVLGAVSRRLATEFLAVPQLTFLGRCLRDDA